MPAPDVYGNPQQNSYVERFNGNMRDELLNGEEFNSAFEARVVRMTDTQISRSFRRSDFSRAACSVIAGNIFGRNTLRATCWVIVLPPAVYARLPRRPQASSPASGGSQA